MTSDDSIESLGVRHGEWTNPDGILTQVTLEIQDGVLADVRVGGTFTVSPASATEPTLQAIAEGLTGAPSDMPVAAVAARVRAAVAFGVDLLGTTPEGIAAAVRRAVDRSAEHHTRSDGRRVGAFSTTEIDHLTARWKELPWRLIPEAALPPSLNVALDEVLVDRVASGLRAPTLRFWQWSTPAIVIGRTQSLANEVDRAAATAAGLEIVRRMTGGGTMFVEPRGALTYSLYLPESAVQGLTIRQSYEVCDAWVVLALRAIGVDAHYVDVNDIACADGKIGGAAQARRKGIVLHHTTLAYEMNESDMASVLRVGREKIRYRGTRSAAKRVSPLVRQTSLPREAIANHLYGWFRSTYGGEVDVVTEDEMAAAEQLVNTKYGTEAWTNEFE
ncbi:lipoate--protein ligase family protein [Fimbriiglobus ruber]|uniref:Lipoate-protein ligase A n=1 Tax=Fimbriiglobus ruber TaxID=1908690 RepID=A0A225DZY9_9BACT|nr:lipoate--protein ligase family protein [Fimbriiglobus ruber]OWK46543.1 Lipoate-protein ligase A [Fimbriiglobus ruber]